ncbi:peptide chain release factor 2 [Thermoclostridium stercorarium subsp. stercorarium DSM 8532]|jgi:peptide chain release factor 2|uniref:Peptide chain release factor 2 n=4 Tax=Thermoclostridium stercorarium TaxID=1510 RepID=L7VLT0_THES1|nr:peptide chain release factor 2 [Thermoclostridium stercorarium subsp. stercorarium DSM 8532]AGI40099.1 bacterial peptide chain release factor-2 [Thermoclostridium stercorarium subsp. stercorarium DSM 8532]ANW99414.1 peptide chain release factor 2 [Thermoclostridium stercorarium subsp. thermolacticum DSM 2910]ANX02039.1 peptide chain release factor 2 [Thermoclostridium stercorarium subsp. leptospartum DSM 9219]
MEKELAELDQKAQEPGFWDDIENSQKILQRSKNLRDKLDGFNKLKTDCEDLLTLVELALEEKDESVFDEVESNFKEIKSRFEKLKLQTLLKGEYDKNDAIFTLHAGAGGTEAMDWVQMLLRMYTRWAENNNYETRILDLLEGEEAGIKSVTVEVKGENAYGFLKSEKGVHRLVRISPFDASGRRHTSFASMEVLPVMNDSDEIHIDPEDIKMDVFRASGAGGQHVNKTSSAVRLTHIPTGIVVTCQNERSQHQNRETAMKMLYAKLLELKEREKQQKINELKGEQMDIAWGSQIRSYIFCPYTLVKDHRTGYEEANVQKVMDGEIDEFISAYLKWNARK